MSQTVLVPENSLLNTGFSIGICAADLASNLDGLLERIMSETFPANISLRRVILIASGCDPKALLFSKLLARRDQRLVLIEEPNRRGKSAAINQILENFEGEFLVLVNSDALPEPGAISQLLHEIATDDHVGMVSASPVVSEGSGITGSVLQLMWSVHNECLSKLSEIDRNNHCCDELIAARYKVLRKLPPDTVNDGAYLAGAAYRAGYSIRFSQRARVRIDVPKNLVDLMWQRRRIVYGHVQIWKSVGESPRTLESMLIHNPLLSFSILVKALAKSPRLMFALPVALIGEVMSVGLAMFDNLSSTKRHSTWNRVGSRS